MSDTSNAFRGRADVHLDQEQYPVEYRQHLDMLKANAARCRELANSASDPEVRQALIEMAYDIDAAVPILEVEKRRKTSAQAS